MGYFSRILRRLAASFGCSRRARTEPGCGSGATIDALVEAPDERSGLRFAYLARKTCLACNEGIEIVCLKHAGRANTVAIVPTHVMVPGYHACGVMAIASSSTLATE
jgi:hypothetical protein